MEYRPKYETVKFIQEIIGGNLCDLRLGKNFLDTMPKAQPIKENKLMIWTLSDK